MSEKYSAGPKRSASWAMSGPAMAMRSVASEPATKEASAAMERAAPARPFWAIA